MAPLVSPAVDAAPPAIAGPGVPVTEVAENPGSAGGRAFEFGVEDCGTAPPEGSRITDGGALTPGWPLDGVGLAVCGVGAVTVSVMFIVLLPGGTAAI